MLRRVLVFLSLLSAIRAEEKFGPYAEPDFPVLTSTVDFTDWEKLGFPKNNIAVRGLIIKLPHDLYVCFDQDLLRVAGIWQGEPGGKFLTFTTIPAISYNVESRKSEPGQKNLPKPIGKPLMATGLMPGWILKAAKDVTPEDLKDLRPPGPDPNEPGRGPVNIEQLQWLGYAIEWNGLVVLAYRERGTPMAEYFDSALVDGKPVVRHAIERSHPTGPLCSVAGIAGTLFPERGEVKKTGDCSVWDVASGGGLQYSLKGGQLSDKPFQRLFVPRNGAVALDEAVKASPWQTIQDAGGAFIVEEIPLPVPNMWRRNVRPSGITFLGNGDAVLCTIDGDVWRAAGLHDAGSASWRRIASGLHEPQSVIVKNKEGQQQATNREELLVFTRDGVIELNADKKLSESGYLNFCNAFTQTGETREYPMDMVAKPGGGFYIAKGGQMVTRKTPQGGHVLEISADGKTVTDICSGLRQPYLGIHPKTGLLTASDQQGHWTPSTAIRYIRKGAYYGFEEAAPNPIPAVIDPPACWIPHEVNQSAAGQVWAVDAKMGPLNDRLLHLMYYRPGILAAFLDDEQKQAAVVPTGLTFDFPLLKGAINPVDGLLYVVGFRIWGTESKNMAGMARIRPTGKPSGIPTAVRAVPQGIHLRFATKLDAASVKPEHFAASRWNYKRTSGYGSAHYKLDGTPGMEPLPCTGAQLSTDGLGVLVHLPAMKPAEQYRLDWKLASAAGAPMISFTTLTLYELRPFDAAAAGFDVSFKPSAPPVIAAAPKEEPTMEAGKQLITLLGCLACHSTDGKMEGMKGPTWKDLFGSEVELEDGKKLTADAAWLRESILDPAKKVRKGFKNADIGMPPYAGLLSDSQVESVILYLRSLSKDGHVQ
jgi:mono/diheme cytochrome c family protein